MAVLLTFCAPAELRRCVEALLAQSRPLDRLLVLDNAGQPPASVTLEGVVDPESRLECRRLATNSGPAGGYATGLSAFLESDCDLAWVMDDDVVPERRCLESLLEHYERLPAPTLLWPTTNDGHGRPANYPGWGFAPLIPRAVVATVGVPRAELFWWAEDTEYLQWRIPRAGYVPIRVPDALVSHTTARRGSAKPSWKYYYEARNSVFYRLHVQRLRHPWKLARTISRMLGTALFVERAIGKGAMVALGCADGLRGRLGKTVPVPAPSSPTGEREAPRG